MTSMVVPRRVILRMRYVTDGSCGENQNKHFVFIKFLSENLAGNGTLWKNVIEPDRPQMSI
jgi:hypothetical protein